MTKLNLTKLIASHKFDYVNINITDKNFPTPKEIGTDFKLFHFDKYISSENAIKEMEKEGYRPASIYELLSWKDWNENDWVVALSSVARVGGYRRVACLYRIGAGRELSLSWFDIVWDAGYRFLAVRNSESKTLEKELSHLDTLPKELTINGIKYIQA